MPKQIIRVRLKNAPEITFTANVNAAGDLPRFLTNAASLIRHALKVYPVIKGHAIERITVAPE